MVVWGLVVGGGGGGDERMRKIDGSKGGLGLALSTARGRGWGCRWREIMLMLSSTLHTESMQRGEDRVVSMLANVGDGREKQDGYFTAQALIAGDGSCGLEVEAILQILNM